MGKFCSVILFVKSSRKVQGSILIDGGYQTKRLREETLEEEIAYYEKDFDEYVLIIGTNFSKVKRSLY